MKKVEDYIITIPDFPKEGIMFRDITGILQDKDGLKLTIDELQKLIGDVDFNIVVGPESRGFIFGVPVAYNMNKAFVPVRKKGKLPRETISEKYALEYGEAEIEVHKDAIKPGDKVVIIDDLIATGGTIEAMIKMIESLGGEIVKIVFVTELVDLGGRKRLEGYNIESIVKYEGE
ncbi:MAG: adenine phosphoribosyltransferase [Lachnospiraceae bacterium]|nr:adenine phosphoribosyltransferase [Lachnospiraceae bacterium]